MKTSARNQFTGTARHLGGRRDESIRRAYQDKPRTLCPNVRFRPNLDTWGDPPQLDRIMYLRVAAPGFVGHHDRESELGERACTHIEVAIV